MIFLGKKTASGGGGGGSVTFTALDSGYEVEASSVGGAHTFSGVTISTGLIAFAVVGRAYGTDGWGDGENVDLDMGGSDATYKAFLTEDIAAGHRDIAVIGLRSMTGSSADFTIDNWTADVDQARFWFTSWLVTGSDGGDFNDTSIIGDASTSQAHSLDVAEGGGVLAIGYGDELFNSITGVTQDFANTDAGDGKYSGSAEELSANATYAVTFNTSSTSEGISIAVALNPS